METISMIDQLFADNETSSTETTQQHRNDSVRPIDTKFIEMVKINGKRAKGKAEFIRYLEGGKLTLKQAALAKCYDCMGYYIDGLQDCGVRSCSLYPLMPYNPNRKKIRQRKSGSGAK